MWIYALPGLSNVWMLLIKATSLLSLLQIADIVQLADRLGAPNFSRSAGFIHPDWRWGVRGSRSPWYPGLSLYRQTGSPDWRPVMRRVADDLAEWAVRA